MAEFQSSFHSGISQAQDRNFGNTILSSFDKAKAFVNLSSSSSSSSPSNAKPTEIPPPLLVRAPRKMVTVGTCSKLCAVFFVAGVIFGYSLKKRVRRWISNLLKWLKDD